ncbi:GtrA family protein [bacterium]|nr:GtrA family protein [bacterium]MBU1636531.1 GtrA family protein [bacterium]MBU1919980.1 GtrA family protein [bacterium]
MTSRPAMRSTTGRIIRFGLVGASGVVVNQGLLMLLHGTAGLPLILSSAIAIECSIMSNFILNSLWTWHYDFEGSSRIWFRKVIEYHAATALSAFVGNIVVLTGLVYLFDIDYRIANLAGIAVGSALNYLASEHWVFRAKSK